MAPPILFLDYDGVLHPAEAIRTYARGIVLPDGVPGRLFMHADSLVRVLEPHPEVRIVLSTSWVQHLDYYRAKKRLPESLQARVIGATWHSHKNAKEWETLTRYLEILTYVDRHNLGLRWLAIDDNADGWPDVQRDKLVHTRSMAGLGDAVVQEELADKLYLLTGGKLHEYSFILRFDNVPEGDADALVESLAKAGCTDALVGIGAISRGLLALSFTRDARSGEAAVGRAIADVKRAVPSARLLEIVHQ